MSRYAQSNNITFEQQNLIMTSLQPWLEAAVSKLKSDAVLSEIWLGVEYQKARGLQHLSNWYLLAFIRSTVQVLWLFAWRRVCWKLQFWTDYNDERKINLGLFTWDSSLELNIKTLENSPSFPSITYTTSLDQWFRRYGILRISKTDENWTGQYNGWKKQNSEA
jgi:hypothetical protein